MNDIRVKYHADITELCRVEGKKSDWIDLRSAEDIYMKAGEFRYISLGVSIQLPDGYEAIVAPRSSTFKNYGIVMANSIGVIDGSYCGDDDIWCFPAYAVRDTHITFNARIAQFRLLWHQQNADIVRVEKLGNPSRGGYGSTGIF